MKQCLIFEKFHHSKKFNISYIVFLVNFRCVNSQQGYSGYSTWTRGLGWAMAGFTELLEFLETVKEEELSSTGSKIEIEGILLKAVLLQN